MARGEAVEVTDPAELARLRKLPLHPWAPGAKTRYVRILPAVLTGDGSAHPAALRIRTAHRTRGLSPSEDGEVRPWGRT